MRRQSTNGSAVFPSVPPPDVRAGVATCYHSMGSSGQVRHNTVINRGPGRRVLKVYGADHDDARAKRDERLRDYNAGLDTITRTGRRPKALTVGDLSLEWLAGEVEPRFDGKGSQVSGLEPGTWNLYRRNVAVYILGYPIHCLAARDLTVVDVQEWRNQMIDRGVGSRSLQLALQRLRSVLKWACRDPRRTGVLKNVAMDMPMPKHRRKRVKKPDLDVLRQLLEAAEAKDAAEGTHFEMMIQVALSLGLRKEELFGLQWGDFDFEARHVLLQRRVVWAELPGDAKPRLLVLPGLKMNDEAEDPVPLHEHILTKLKAHRTRLKEHWLANRRSWKGPAPTEPTGWVFPQSNGTVESPRKLDWWYYSTAKRLGIKHTPHKLRHDHGSLLINGGVPLVQVQRILRHSSIAVTNEHYIHLLPELQHEAMGVMSGVMKKLSGS